MRKGEVKLYYAQTSIMTMYVNSPVKHIRTTVELASEFRSFAGQCTKSNRLSLNLAFELKMKF